MKKTTEEAVLLWALYPDGYTMPDARDIDPESLLRLAIHHRVSSRLYMQLETQLPSGLSRRFMTRLRFVEHQRRNLFRQQIAYAQMLAKQFGSVDNPLIFLKGFSSYAVTGDERLKRPIGDFDLIAANLPQLFDSLTTSGFFGNRHFTHEFGKLTDGSETVDLHEFFPVRSYPTNCWLIEPSTLTLPTTFDLYRLPDLPPDFVETGVYYNDLLRHSQKGIAPSTEQLTFPTPEMACLILCAHAFRDVTVRFHYLGDQVLLRLGELADVNTIASAPHFNRDNFIALVNRYNATDSVTWVARQCERFLGQSFLPCFAEKSSRTALTVEHLAMGSWVYICEPSLLTRSGDTVLNRLNCKTVRLKESEITPVLLRPILYHASVPSIEMQVEWIHDHITFNLELEPDTQSLRFLFLNDRYFICYFRDGKVSQFRFKDLNLADCLLPHGEPQTSNTGKSMHLRIPFICPAPITEISCFFELQTKTLSAYVPLRFILADRATCL